VLSALKPLARARRPSRRAILAASASALGMVGVAGLVSACEDGSQTRVRPSAARPVASSAGPQMTKGTTFRVDPTLSPAGVKALLVSRVDSFLRLYLPNHDPGYSRRSTTCIDLALGTKSSEDRPILWLCIARAAKAPGRTKQLVTTFEINIGPGGRASVVQGSISGP
jgi:hypothetical protein